MSISRVLSGELFCDEGIDIIVKYVYYYGTVNAIYYKLYMSHKTSRPHVNPCAETIRLGPLAVDFLITAEYSNGTVAVFEVTVPPGQRLPAAAHSHDHYEETIYGIEGVLTWNVDGKPVEVGPGQALCIPRGAIHRFDNNGMAEAKALCMITPAAIGPLFFRESAEVINAAAGGPPDRAKMAEIMRRHGLTPAPPPPQS
jgi:quercetin dioxygenase-like cupin family protein